MLLKSLLITNNKILSISERNIISMTFRSSGFKINYKKEFTNEEKLMSNVFTEQISRKPNKYEWTNDFIEAMHNGFWTDKEFSFASDLQDFRTKLTEEERDIIIKTLSAIGQIEVAVKTFWAKLGDNLPHPSIQDMGYVMANVEVIHNMAYERLLTVLGLEDIFEENLKLDCINGRVKYLKKYTHKFYKDSKKQYIYALILFTLFVENVSLFSQFYIILWFNKYKNLLKDTSQQVKYTLNEEGLHAEIGIKLINTIREEMPELFDKDLEDRILHEAEEAYNAESKIVDWMIGDYSEKDLNKDILKEFIKNRINKSLNDIGFKKIFDIDKDLLAQTIWFEEMTIGDNLVDFFNSRPVDYSKSNQSFDPENFFNDNNY